MLENVPKFAQYIPIVLTLVEMLKRFIPDKARNYLNPVLSVVIGVGTAYVAGGYDAALTLLRDGALAGLGAMGAYSGTKYLGKAVGTES